MTLNRCRRWLATLALLSTCSLPAWADDGISFKLSGYGTLGAVVTNTDEAQFRQSGRQDRGADKSPDLGVDSRLGLQANVTFDERFSAVTQVLASRVDGGDKLLLEWLYAQAKLMPWLELRAGRMVLPVFLVSDSRNVGYASHWLRAPTEVYSLFPSTSFDGLQARARTTLAGTQFSLQVSAGKSEAKLFLDSIGQLDLKIDDIKSINLVAERGDWTLRYGRTESHTTLSGAPFPLPPNDDVFSGVGLQFDNGTLLAMAEYVTRRPGIGASDSYYVSAGYRVDAWTPYATVARFVPKGSIFNGAPDGKTEAIGVRWDVVKNVAVKAQLESTVNGTNFIKASAAFATEFPKVTVFSVAADFVF